MTWRDLAATLAAATALLEALDSEADEPRVTASELAFLALGLVLGAATGAALIFVLDHRAPRREIRVTVTRDAVPRRSETLSQDAFVTSPAEPARGGPGDRRWLDRRDLPASDPAPRPAGTSPVAPPRAPAPGLPARAVATAVDRTAVPSRAPAAAPAPAPVATAVGIAIHPEPDPELDDITRRPARGAMLERMLRGEHRAMVEVVDRIAGEDSHRRRDWEVLIGGLVEGLREIAVDESIIDFPMGTPFWDTFTVEQCRHVVAALQTTGYHYDGGSGWTDQRIPSYRDLAQALADIGVDPRRVRAWPNQTEIAALFVGARPAPEELLPAAGPEYDERSMRALLGHRAARLESLWLAWDAVRPLLFEEPAAADAVIEA